MYILLSDAKQHLNVDKDFHADDEYIISLINVAEDVIAKRIDVPLHKCVRSDGYLIPSVRHAILLLIGTYYNNREDVTNQATNQLPTGFEYLANLNKCYQNGF